MKRILIIVVIFISAVSIHAASFDGSLIVSPNWTHSSTGVTTVAETFSTLLLWNFTSGTNAHQMNQLWRKRSSVIASGTNQIDIAGGITNAFGEALNMSEVRMMIFSMATNQLNNISIGAAASTPFSTWLGDASDKVVMRPGGFFLLTAPDATAYAVSTNSVTTNSLIRITNEGTNTITYDVYIGASSE